ncbi:MAG: hypothetical protein M5U15_11730 [Kiritimatiellae bacterium]|nr:hypothetical protein [Kiritimatiellia bacterium]
MFARGGWEVGFEGAGEVHGAGEFLAERVVEVGADALFFPECGGVNGVFESDPFVHFFGELAVGVLEFGGAEVDGFFDGAGAAGLEGDEGGEEDGGGGAADQNEEPCGGGGVLAVVVGGGFVAEGPGLVGEADGGFKGECGGGGAGGDAEGGVVEGDLHLLEADLLRGAAEEELGLEPGEREAGEGVACAEGAVMRMSGCWPGVRDGMAAPRVGCPVRAIRVMAGIWPGSVARSSPVGSPSWFSGFGR